ncbi:hypothetical protein ACHAWF_013404 [Thalassiosira exigua]
MDVDAAAAPPSSGDASAPGPSAASAAAPSPRTVKIHPLAIIGISDHHTRVASGGSGLPPTAPVVGLLFGHRGSSDGGGGGGRDVSIVDAEEMEYPGSMGGDDSAVEEGRQAVRKKIELHRAVFPRHAVVGWYRVRAGGDGPNEEDLRVNQAEMARYCRGEGEDQDGEGDGEGPLFVLMDPSGPDDGGDGKPKSSSSSAKDAAEELDGDLPLTVYETLEEAGGGVVFVGADFELETYEPERIAVERVFKTQPPTSSTAGAPSKEAEERKGGKKGKKEVSGREPAKPPYSRGPSELEGHLDALQSSIRSMNARVGVLLEFLRGVERGEIPPDDGLLRSVNGLVGQLPLVLAALEEGQAMNASLSSAGPSRRPLREMENDYDDTVLLSYLAAVAKTARSVHLYTEKFRVACESGKVDPRRSLF